MVTHYVIYLLLGIYIYIFVKSKASYYLHSKQKQNVNLPKGDKGTTAIRRRQDKKCTNADFSATQMICARSLFTWRYHRTVFSDNKKSRLEKANSYTQKHKHKYFNFQLAVRVISLTYTSRKLDKVIFGTVRLPNTPPLSASFVCQVLNVAWQSLCKEHFLPLYHPIFWATKPERGR